MHTRLISIASFKNIKQDTNTSITWAAIMMNKLLTFIEKASDNSRFFATIAASCFMLVFGYFIYLIVRESLSGGFWSDIEASFVYGLWEILLALTAILIASVLACFLTAYLCYQVFFRQNWFRSPLSISLRFLAGLPMMMVLSVYVGFFQSIGLYSTTSFLVVSVSLALAMVPTAMLVFSEIGQTQSDSRGAATALGLSRSAIFWRITLPDNRRLLVLATGLCLVRIVAEGAIIFNRSDDLPSLIATDELTIYALADLLSQAVSPQDNVFLVLLILVISVLSRAGFVVSLFMGK